MRHKLILYCGLFLVLLQNCKTTSIPQAYKYNFYVFNATGLEYDGSIVYQEKEYIVSKIRKARYNYDPEFIKKQFDFVKHEDTMRLFCFFIGPGNYYLKNFKFKKGSYLLKSSESLKVIEGNDIRSEKELHQKLLRDYLIVNPNPALSTNEIQRNDMYFRDIKFKVIDFSDSLNVSLTPLSEEEFWSNEFLPNKLNTGGNKK